MEKTKKIIRNGKGREIGYKWIYKDDKGRITGSSALIDCAEKEAPEEEKTIGIDEKVVREVDEEAIKARKNELPKIPTKNKGKDMPHKDKPKKKTRKKKKKSKSGS